MLHSAPCDNNYKAKAITCFRATTPCFRETNDIKRKDSIIQEIAEVFKIAEVFSIIAEVFKIAFQLSDVNMKNKNVRKSVSHAESFFCQSHLYMSFHYSEYLFHRNNLNLDLYHPKIFSMEWIERNLDPFQSS